MIGVRGFDSQRRLRIFLFTTDRVQNGSGAHPSSYPMGRRALSPEVKGPGPPPPPPVCLHGVVFKHRNNFIFTFTFTFPFNFTFIFYTQRMKL
jgi:hypothetical protein